MEGTKHYGRKELSFEKQENTTGETDSFMNKMVNFHEKFSSRYQEMVIMLYSFAKHKFKRKMAPKDTLQ